MMYCTLLIPVIIVCPLLPLPELHLVFFQPLSEPLELLEILPSYSVDQRVLVMMSPTIYRILLILETIELFTSVEPLVSSLVLPSLV